MLCYFKLQVKLQGSGMVLFTGVQYLRTLNVVAPLFITFYQIFRRRCTQSERPSLLMFRIDRHIAPSLVLYRDSRSGSFTLAKRS